MKRIWMMCLLLGFSQLGALETKETKIVYFTVPKGGSQLFRKVIQSIIDRPLRKIYPRQDLSFLDTYIGYNHLGPGYDEILEDTTGSFIKMIMIRDPRDVIISMISWIEVMGDTEAAKEFCKRSLDEQITELIAFPNLAMNGRYPFIFDTHLEIKYALQWMANPDVLVCRFEDLVGDRGGGADARQIELIHSLSRHLGCDLPIERVRAIAEDLFGGTVTFRKGQIGSWREVFTQEHKELFKRKMGKELIELRYEQDYTW